MPSATHIRILEEQVDTLAGRVAMLERRWERLMDWLCEESVAARLELYPESIRRACHASVLPGETAVLRHANERSRRIREAASWRIAGE